MNTGYSPRFKYCFDKRIVQLFLFLLVVAPGRQVMAQNSTNIGHAEYKLPDFCQADATGKRPFPEMPASLKCAPIPESYIATENGNVDLVAAGVVKNKNVLIALGKMLFWDSQVGSDGLACASCHFQAGADNRIKNQINPGMLNASSSYASDGFTPIGKVFDFMASSGHFSEWDPLRPSVGKGPNYTLKKADFPLRQYKEPDDLADGQPLQADRNAEVVYDSDDVISSQGAYYSLFTGLSPKGKKEVCQKNFSTAGPRSTFFNVKGYSVRQVEPRNTPTVINSVYNFRNFWDGRANNVFNGLDPFGLRRFANPEYTPGDEIYIKDANGNLRKKRIVIYNASLASQAVGPALSDFEMSCGGKSFNVLGKKMLTLKPLQKQKIDVSDSVLGSYAKPDVGIKSQYTYKNLIQSAFNNAYWDVPDSKTINGYKLIENNFSLFWGLAIQAYEATLISDESRFDQAQEDPINGLNQLTEQERHGLNLYLNEGKCIACHSGPELTAASVSHVANLDNTPNTSKYIERMLMGDGGVALYDAGFYNIGVRPSVEDLGVGASDPYGYPLSFTRNAKSNANDPNDFSIEFPTISSLSPDPFNTNSALFDTEIGCLFWNPATTAFGYLCATYPVVRDERDAVDGAFKTPGLRNVELTGPYFHNGGQATLEQVIQFYNRGGDRKDLFVKNPDCSGALLTQDAYGNQVVTPDPETGLIDNSGFLSNAGSASNIAPNMAGTKELLDTTCTSSQSPHETLNLSRSDVADLVAFLKTLTDERVRWEKAPFDHPSLVIPNGHIGDEVITARKSGSSQAPQINLELPAVGAGGRQAKGLPALKAFEDELQ